MKTKLISLPTARICVVSVPEDAIGLYLAPPSTFLGFNTGPYKNDVINVGPGNWQLLGRLDQVTEEQARLAVDATTVDTMVYSGTMTTSLEHFISLMQSHGIYIVNPYGKGEPQNIPYLGAMTVYSRRVWKEWQEAQLFTNPVILIEKK